MSAAPDVVVLAGGAARRFGADKLALLLDRVLDGLPAGVGLVVCVGPERATRRPGVVWTREDPPLGGPLAALAAGAARTSSAVVVVVGGDMPAVGGAVEALAAAVRVDRPVALLVDAAGRRQPLASAWRRDVLVARLAALGPVQGRALHALLDTLDAGEVVEVPDAWEAARDVDVPGDLTR